MKTKNFFLACVAVLFAAAGAYASMFAAVRVHVYGKMNSVNGITRCVRTNVFCNDTPSSKLCQVSISTSSGTQIANSTASGTPYTTYQPTACVTQLFDDSPGAVVTQTATPELDEDEVLFSLAIPQ